MYRKSKMFPAFLKRGEILLTATIKRIIRPLTELGHSTVNVATMYEPNWQSYRHLSGVGRLTFPTLNVDPCNSTAHLLDSKSRYSLGLTPVHPWGVAHPRPQTTKIFKLDIWGVWNFPPVMSKCINIVGYNMIVKHQVKSLRCFLKILLQRWYEMFLKCTTDYWQLR